MEYGYYPGCSLTGSARRLDRDVRAIFRKMGHTLKEIPEWNCCGALEYGDRKELVALSAENLKKAEGVCRDIVAPCPACMRNLKEANGDNRFSVLSPLDLFDREAVASLKVGEGSQGKGIHALLRLRAPAASRDGHQEPVRHGGGDHLLWRGSRRGADKGPLLRGRAVLREQEGHGAALQAHPGRGQGDHRAFLSLVPHGPQDLLQGQEDRLLH